jgi:two-component system chemotaxis response regulator CheB
MAVQRIIAIGGSAGSIQVIRQICSALPPDLNASAMIAVHVGSGSPNLLADILDSAGPLPATTASDGVALRAGHIYVAPSDHHLLLDGQLIRLGRGPRENMARPAIDPLFRSVGISARAGAIGILLSGMLNDGASGLADLKRCGGLTVVQNPLDSIEGEMPRAALLASDIDYRAGGGEMADLVVRLLGLDLGPAPIPPSRVGLEVAIAMGRPSDTPTLSEIADPVPLNCPACGGTLSQLRHAPLRFRCQVGHGYTAEALIQQQVASVDEAVRIATRVIGERAVLMEKMAAEAITAGRTTAGTEFTERAAEYRNSAVVLMNAVQKMS